MLSRFSLLVRNVIIHSLCGVVWLRDVVVSMVVMTTRCDTGIVVNSVMVAWVIGGFIGDCCCLYCCC